MTKADGMILRMGKRVEIGIHLFEKMGNASILAVNDFHACLFIISFESLELLYLFLLRFVCAWNESARQMARSCAWARESR